MRINRLHLSILRLSLFKLQRRRKRIFLDFSSFFVFFFFFCYFSTKSQIEMFLLCDSISFYVKPREWKNDEGSKTMKNLFWIFMSFSQFAIRMPNVCNLARIWMNFICVDVSRSSSFFILCWKLNKEFVQFFLFILFSFFCTLRK